ncbi:hypothetical protein D3C80_1152070 [compost metagenome]
MQDFPLAFQGDAVTVDQTDVRVQGFEAHVIGGATEDVPEYTDRAQSFVFRNDLPGQVSVLQFVVLASDLDDFGIPELVVTVCDTVVGEVVIVRELDREDLVTADDVNWITAVRTDNQATFATHDSGVHFRVSQDEHQQRPVIVGVSDVAGKAGRHDTSDVVE